MKTRAFPFSCLLFCGIFIANAQQLWSLDDTPHGPATPVVKKSDRERFNLRGPVKTFQTETTSPSRTLPGREIPGHSGSYTAEFDSAGNLTSQESRGGPEYSVRYEHDASGRLLKQIFTSPNQETTESLYSYDDQGRELSVVDSKTPDNPLIFHYDKRGRKSMVLTSRPEDYKPESRGTMGSPFSDAANRPPNLPGGGTSTVLYDELDRPVEAQARDSNGTLIMRALRTYDAQGNIIEDKDAMETQAKAPSKVESSDSADCDDDNEKIYSVSHAYDEKGRMKLTVTRSSQKEEWTEFTYNDHGDTSSTITISFEKGSESQSSYYEYHTEYKYDSHGNWTESANFFRHSPDGKFEPTDRSQRTITYF